MTGRDLPAGLQAVSHCLHLRQAPALATTATCRSGMGFVELRGDRGDVGISEPLRDDAFLVSLHLKQCPDFDLYSDRRLYRHRDFVAGSVTLYDMRTSLQFDLRTDQSRDVRSSFHAIDFYLPCSALDALARDYGSSRVDELRHEPGRAFDDPIARSLLMSIQPALARPGSDMGELFVDHVAMALAIHAAQTHGGMRPRREAPRGGLAPWQERRAKELLAARLGANVTLAELAGVCALSVRHFTRAFRVSTGMSAHAWLVEQRLEKAKGLLGRTDQGLAEIALACGFADQSHLSRSFQRSTGMSPGAWRRLHRR